MAQRGDRYYIMVRRVTLPKKFIHNIPFDNIIFDLPITIKIEDGKDKLIYQPTVPFSQKLCTLREDEEGSLSSFIIEEEGTGSIKEEELTNIFFTLFTLLSSLYILPSMFYVYSGSKILVVSNNNNTITFDINITFLFAPQTIFGEIRDFLEFIKFIDRQLNRWFSYCGRCAHLYSANAPPLGCPCLLEESSGADGYDTD